MGRPERIPPAASLATADSCTVLATAILAEAAVTSTAATGMTATVIAAVPLFPSLVAVIVADPTATAVTRPLADTVATAGALLDQVTSRPVSTLPAESFVVAVSCTVAPALRLFDAGDTVTVATGTTVTVIADVPFLPSLVAVIVADPAPTAVTSPLAETVAAAGALLAQVTARPARGLPLASFGVAVIWTVCPSSTVAEAGFTDTDATGTNVTVIAAVPFWPSLLAVIVAVPAAPPVTSPFPLTEATAALLVAHVTVRPLSGLPFASFGVAASCAVWPTITLADAGLTDTDATGTTVTVIATALLCPSHATVTVATPAATPVTSPLPFTVATPRLVEAHVTTRPLNGLPPTSCGVAVSCTVCPTATLAAAGLTRIDVTGASVTVTTDVSAGPPERPLATTLTLPVSAPARYRPLCRPLFVLVSMMVPLVALQLTARSAVSPVLVKAMAVKSAAWFCCSVRSLGETSSRAASLPDREVLDCISHATNVRSASARARRHIVRESINPPQGLRRLD